MGLIVVEQITGLILLIQAGTWDTCAETVPTFDAVVQAFSVSTEQHWSTKKCPCPLYLFVQYSSISFLLTQDTGSLGNL